MCMASIPVTFLVLTLIISVLVAAVGVGDGEPGRFLRTACDTESCSLSGRGRRGRAPHLLLLLLLSNLAAAKGPLLCCDGDVTRSGVMRDITILAGLFGAWRVFRK